MVLGKGFIDRELTADEVREIVFAQLDADRLGGKRVLAIIPDSTRTAPVAQFVRLLCEKLHGHAAKLDFIIALGTHPPMPEDKIAQLVGMTASEREAEFPGVNVFNHSWDQPETLANIGTFTKDEVEEVSGGLMRETINIHINRIVFDYDHLIIVGPTFPHEVVGFSGGHKYLFPGIAGPEIINAFHWLGALITNYAINGTKETPVRDVVERAAARLDIPRTCFSLVMKGSQHLGLYAGAPPEAFSAAADLSAKVNIIYVDREFNTVLSISPPMYDDIWTAGKCMYKLEPILAQDAKLIIYAPHIDEISYSHGRVLDQIGYHVRDYFVKQMDKFAGVPRGVIAHSTHVKGMGTFESGIEKPRAEVILATKIPEARCRQVNLGYLDPASIDRARFEGREDEGVLCVPKAGEMLYHVAKDKK